MGRRGNPRPAKRKGSADSSGPRKRRKLSVEKEDESGSEIDDELMDMDEDTLISTLIDPFLVPLLLLSSRFHPLVK